MSRCKLEFGTCLLKNDLVDSKGCNIEKVEILFITSCEVSAQKSIKFGCFENFGSLIQNKEYHLGFTTDGRMMTGVKFKLLKEVEAKIKLSELKSRSLAETSPELNRLESEGKIKIISANFGPIIDRILPPGLKNTPFKPLELYTTD